MFFFEYDRIQGFQVVRMCAFFLHALLARGECFELQGVDMVGHFIGQGGINKALALDPALSFEGLRHHRHREVAFAFGVGARVARVLGRIIDDVQAFRI